MPYTGTTVGQILRVTAANGLNARYDTGKQVMVQGSKPARPLVRPRGYLIQFGERRTINGRIFIRARGNLPHWYAQEFLEQYTPPPKVTRVATPVPGWKMTTPFGKRPRNNTYWRLFGYHEGADWAAPSGAKAVAVRSGVARHYTDGTLGTIVLLYADNGCTYWYCHLSKRSVANGAKVKAGQELGRVGATGSGAQGPHLHVSKRQGHRSDNFRSKPLDPMVW